MKTFILTHSHRYGVGTYTFKSETDRKIFINNESYKDREDIEDIITHFNIDFEQRWSETIEIAEVEQEEIPVI